MRAVARLVGDVDAASVAALLDRANAAAERGEPFDLLLSTPGGKVAPALAAYHALRVLPVEVRTHNLGICDSAGLLLFAAGARRTTEPHARFLLHPLGWDFGEERLEAPQIEERLAKLRADARNVALALAEATGRSPGEVAGAMARRTILNARGAVAFGLAHEVRRAAPAWGRFHRSDPRTEPARVRPPA